MLYTIFFVAGLIAGTAITLIINRFRQKEMKESFSAISLDALRKNSDEFIKLATQTLSAQTQVGSGQLEEKKKLIDQTLEGIKGELVKVENTVKDFDSKRELAFGAITTQLKNTAEQTNKLQGTTDKLQLALANTRARGQWGERIAEDILQLVGFVENFDYTKQKTQEATGTRPDFTFVLPQNLKVNMDSKFPFDNYSNYVNAESNSDKDSYKQKFMSDVRKKIKEVKTRDYINPEDNTVDYAIMFVPNEQVFCFLHENDADVFDDALKDKVILCSPVTLFAILCVIREAVKVFKLQKATGEILQLLNAFNKQWGEFKKCMDKMGEQIEKAHEEFGKLKTTRSNKLEIPLRHIDTLSKQTGLLESPLVDAEPELESPDEEASKTESSG
ncbi:MAG: DNA recombination protein RmuC [Dehalococcoidales bacterium]|nr:DNA recombination protein RmuC [Dehalococcoidales bacterium]